MIIYKLTSKTSGKSYIGQTCGTVETRFKGHCFSAIKKQSSTYIHKAIKKHGSDDFLLEVLEEVTSEEANEKESYWISFYKTFGEGYNLTPGGDCSDYSTTRGKTYEEIYAHKGGAERAEEKKRKMRESSLGKIISEETKIRMRENHFTKRMKNTWSSEFLTGKTQPKHINDKRSKTLREYWDNVPEEIRNKKRIQSTGSNNPNYGNKWSDELKQKVKDNWKTNYPSKTCPHCGKTCAPSMAKRWHFDNCKEKNNESENKIN